MLPKMQHRLLTKLGYSGPADADLMNSFMQSNPSVAAKMGKFETALRRGFNVGGLVATDLDTAKQNLTTAESQLLDVQRQLEENPDDAGLQEQNEALAKNLTRAQQDVSLYQGQQERQAPTGTEVKTAAIETPKSLTTGVDVAKVGAPTPDQLISEATGQADKVQTEGATAVEGVAEAKTPEVKDAAKVTAAKAGEAVGKEADSLEAVKGQVSEEATVEAVTSTESAVSDLEAAQGSAILMENPVTREIQEGELISGSSVDAAKVEKLNESIQAATATPSKKATVQGQLEGLMQDFEGGETPAWAAGAIRNANAIMAQRGLSASSMAGQAVIQATMESALPIAQADANTRAQFEAQNLSNRQQTALFAAQQRADFLKIEFDQEFQARVRNAATIADIANMNFTAEQRITLENSRIANTTNLQNLSNRQAMVMAEASALANLDIQNLNNRQQAAVQNAQNFLQMDLTNLNNEQQTAIFKSQQRINSILTDQAAENAALQFNAASENQVNQFFAELSTNVSRFNADQTNAISQFNAGQENADRIFNAQIEAAREQFNAQNSLVIAQANAKWRQDISTLDTAAQNEANLEDARTANIMTKSAMDELLMKERDLLAFSYQSGESALDRELELLLADKREDLVRWQEEKAEDAAKGQLITMIGADLLFGGGGGGSFLGGLF